MKNWYIPVAIFGVMAAVMVYRMVKFGGWRGSMFSARISKHLGDIVSKPTAFRRVKMKVYALEDPTSAEPRVGLEIHTSAMGAWHMTPMSISRAEALELSRMLTDAFR